MQLYTKCSPVNGFVQLHNQTCKVKLFILFRMRAVKFATNRDLKCRTKGKWKQLPLKYPALVPNLVVVTCAATKHSQPKQRTKNKTSWKRRQRSTCFLPSETATNGYAVAVLTHHFCRLTKNIFPQVDSSKGVNDLRRSRSSWLTNQLARPFSRRSVRHCGCFCVDYRATRYGTVHYMNCMRFDWRLHPVMHS